MIATYKDAVCPHFGHAPEFRLVEIDGNKVVKEEVHSNPGHVPGALPKWMKSLGVDV
ncbi:MAG TPA: NifB/NifX family molybdenum-iron cluster-binding protein, partial [Thermosynergistes sp.]|nr:NifB/NifX family molybdenum-iron cluster-binding protein [Thermosynergistes sp.]